MTHPGTPEGAPPEGTPPPAAAAAAPPPAAPPAEVDLDSPLTQEQFDRGYVEKLRAEAAKHRTAAKEAQARYEAQFEGLEDESDFQYLLGMAKKLNTDPHASRQELLDLAERLGKDLGIGTTPPPADDDKDKPLTKADLEKIEYEREVARQQQLLVQEAASYSDDHHKFEDGQPEYAQLLWLAQHDPEASKGGKDRLKLAADKIKAKREEIGKAAVAAYIESVRSGASQFPPASAPAGGAPAGAPGASSPKSWKDASASAMEKLIRGTL